MSYLRSMPSVSQYMKKDFDYVLGLYNRDNDILSKYYPDDYAEVLTQEVEEMPTTNNPLGLKLMRLFIDEFQDTDDVQIELFKSIQKKIAEILDKIDSKIENNNMINC